MGHPRSGRPQVLLKTFASKPLPFTARALLYRVAVNGLRWAEKYLKDHPEVIDCIMSHSTIDRILKMHALRPNLKKYFLQITDLDFFPKIEHIAELYLNPPEYLFVLMSVPVFGYPAFSTGISGGGRKDLHQGVSI